MKSIFTKIPSLFILWVLAGGVVHAQMPPGQGQPKIGKVSGFVVEDSTGAPIEYAVITLMRIKDSLRLGGITDAKGFFQVTEIPPGFFRFKVGFVGYKTYYDSLTITPETPGRVFEKITLKPTMTEEVKITAEASMIESGIDKKVYYVGKDISSAGSTAADILQNVPSVTMDMDRNVQLRGSANVNILINGRPSTLTGQGGLEQLPASMIERIEIVTNPSAKYDPDGMSGIINIITRNNTDKGLSGSLSMTAGTGSKYNPALYLNYRQKKVNIYTNINFQRNRNFQRSEMNRENFIGDTTFSINQNSDGYNIQQNLSLSIGADFTLSPKTTLGMSGMYSLRERDEYSTILYDFLDESGTVTQNQQRDNEQLGTPRAMEGSLYLKHVFKTPDHNIMFDVAYSGLKNIDDLNATQQYTIGLIAPDYFQHTTTDRANRIITPQINYTKTFKGNHKIEAGMKAILRNIDQDFFSEHSEEGSLVWVMDTNISNHIVYDDKVLSAYTVYTGAIKNFGYSMGLRAEKTFYSVNQLATGDEFDNQYLSLFPTAALKYKFKNMHELGGSYSRRINRPNIENLNPFPEWRDPFNLMVGNPFLRPEFTNSFEVSYRGFVKKFNFTTSVYYKQTDSAITRYRTVSGEGVATVTFANISQTRQWGTELILQIDPFKWWNMNISFNGFYQTSQAGNLAAGLSNTGFGGNVRYMGNFKFWKTASVQVIYNKMFPFIVPQGRGGPGQWLDIGLRKEFLKDNRLGVTLRVTDIFDTRKFQMNTSDATYVGTVAWKRESRIGYLGLSYRFGNGKPAQPKRNTEEQPSMEGGAF
jgi:outer membrane receptor protein involved in Fe transport